MSSDQPDNSANDDIPLLEDVVIPEELEMQQEIADFEEEDTERPDSITPEYDKVLQEMREDILHQLQVELHPLLVKSVELAIEEALKRAERVLHHELTRPMEHRLRALLEERMKEEFGPKEQHLDGEAEN